MDGRRLYGPYDATKSLAWGLDACNGRWETNGRYNSTPEVGQNALYNYRATPSFPYLIGCAGPAGTPLGEATAAAAAASDVVYSATDAGFLVEEPHEGCPAGSFLSVDTGECEACQAGTYGKDAGLVGKECPGVSFVDHVARENDKIGHTAAHSSLRQRLQVA